VVVAKQTLSLELRGMAYRSFRPDWAIMRRPREAIEDFKKASPGAWKRSGAQRASIPAP
jgi:hypothetical protein